MTPINRTEARTSALLDGKYWEFFVPTILMAMTLTMSIVVDSIIVGNMLGADALAAVNLVMPVVMVYNTVAVCLGLGAATIISIAKGRRDPELADSVFTTVLFFMVLAGVLMLIGQELSLDRINMLLTREPSLRPLVKSYLHVLVYGTPLIVTVPGLAYCLRVDGRVKLASAILIISNLVNLALDLVYMGPLKMGIAGSSLATVSGYVVGGVCLLAYAFSDKRTLRFRKEALARVGELLRRLGTIVKTGFPAAMGSILITFKILSINHIVLAEAGKSGMVAFSVCLSCLSFVSMFISGAAQAMTPIVGVLYGENDHLGVRFVIRRAFITLMIASLAATLLLELAPAQILELFGVRHAADMAEGIPAIRIFSLSLIGTSTTFLSMYYYMTIGRTKLSTAISIVQGASVVPFALLLSHLMGVAGVWAAFSLAEVTTILMIAAVYFRLRARQPQKYDSPLLLDKEQLPKGHRLETTCVDAEGIEGVVQQVREFSRATAMSAETETAVISAVHDAATALFGNTPPKNKYNTMDIRIDVLEDTAVVTLRDSARDFTLAESGCFGGACDVKQSQAIGFNNHTLTFAMA